MTSFEFFLESRHNCFGAGHTGNTIRACPLKVPEAMLRNRSNSVNSLRNGMLRNETQFKPLNFLRYLQVKDKLILGLDSCEHFLDRV